MSCALGAAIGETSYQDHKGRPKVVRYWVMEPGHEPPSIRTKRWTS